MAKRIKPIPKNQSQIIQTELSTPYLSQGKAVSESIFSENRGTDYSFKEDNVKDVSIGLKDIDNAVLQYIINNIKPTVIQNEQRLAVPVIYGSPERWKSIQNDGFYRDKNGKLMVPLIMLKRESIEKNRALGNKLDGNKVHNYQVIGTRFNQRNIYDNFSVLNNRIPSKQYYISSVPDYINVVYSCIIFTDYIEQNNKLIESLQFASDSYWGNPDRFKFRANIDSFNTPVVLEQGQDRAARSSFNIKLFGYILPDTINKDLAVSKSKFYTKAQVVFNLETVEGDIDTLSTITTPNNIVGSTSFVGGGNNITNDNTINNYTPVDVGDITYLNTNITKIANTISGGNTAIFVGVTILEPGPLSTLPATSVDNFTFYINGKYESSSLVTLTEGGGNVTLVFNTVSLGYTLESDDEVIAIGKFE
jgi:hypothetical protein